jgi:acyl carrier protein phosphodiesterase
MNYLAHLYLAAPRPDAMLGALLGDFVFGRAALEDWPEPVRTEILVHRRIDSYTDRHPQVTAARALFPDGLRRYAGIVLDVYYDHCLARDWLDYSPRPLGAFTAAFYPYLLEQAPALPERLRRLAPLMVQGDWLGSYARRASVDQAVTRIATRLSRNGQALVDCLQPLRLHEARIQASFQAFFPQLRQAVPGMRQALAGAD